MNKCNYSGPTEPIFAVGPFRNGRIRRRPPTKLLTLCTYFNHFNLKMSASTVHPAKPYETKQTMNADYSAQYDYVMVFKTEAADGKCKQPAAAKACMTAMIAAGLEIFPYKSCQEDEIFVLIRAPVRES